MSARARAYLALAVIGATIPFALTWIFIADHGPDLGRFLEDTVSNTAAVLVVCDLVFSAFVFLWWAWGESRRIGIAWWPFVFATTLIGVCFALPLFMHFRQRHADAALASG